jgi:hypothetical protein
VLLLNRESDLLLDEIKQEETQQFSFFCYFSLVIERTFGEFLCEEREEVDLLYEIMRRTGTARGERFRRIRQGLGFADRTKRCFNYLLLI